MMGLSLPEWGFVIFAFLMEILLIVHFALRRWRFEKAMRMGWVYGVLGIPGVLLSIYLWLAGMAWYFVIAGFLTGAWALLGFYVDGVKGIEWRGPIYWPVFIPYILLYLGAQMFFWWDLLRIYKPLWYIYLVLYIISTLLNAISHPKIKPEEEAVT